MAEAKGFTFSIENFDGDPDLINFFFDQIVEYARIKDLSKQETVFFLKSKLKGPAQKYLVENPILYQATDFEFIEKEFKKFFAKNSSATFLNQLNNLSMLPQETVKNFAHRLNVLSSKVYTNINDKESKDHIKFVKFVACLPSNIRVKLQEEGIKDFDKAVDRAQVLQDIFVQEQILISNPICETMDSVQQQLNMLTEKINYLTFSDHNNKVVEKSPEPIRDRRKFTKDSLTSNFKSRQAFNSYNRYRQMQKKTNSLSIM